MAQNRDDLVKRLNDRASNYYEWANYEANGKVLEVIALLRESALAHGSDAIAVSVIGEKLDQVLACIKGSPVNGAT